VVQVDDDLRGRADELARALAAQRRLAPPQPLGRSGDGEALLLEPALWQAMLDAMTGPA
jgi:predicted transcriptional regulator